MWKDYFTKHPRSVGESYEEHMRIAEFVGIRMIFSGLACCLHGVFPFLFVDTASQTVRNLHEEMQARKNKE